MDVKIDFNPEEIAQKMHEAIINTAFKQMFTNAVTEECKRLTESTWNTNSIVQQVVRDYISRTIRDMLETEYKPRFEAIIREKITGERLEAICGELVEKIKVTDRY